MKKHLKWIIPLIALVLIGTAVILLSGILNTGDDIPTTAPVEQPMKVYWNVDGENYRGEDAPLRTRSEGKYRALFAVDGEQLDLFFADSELMAQADALDMMGLEIDENNHVTRVIPVDEFTGGVAVYKYYVESFTEDTIVTNSTMNYRGLPLVLKQNGNTKVYDIGQSGPLAGMPGSLAEGCEITAIQDKNGILTHVFIKQPFAQSPVYYNVVRMYDTTNKTTTRTSDMLGVYTFEFAVDGELVELKAREEKLATIIDAFAAKCMHLVFDEDGYIIEAKHPRYATGGNSAASWFHVMELNGNEFFAEKFSGSDKGDTANLTMAEKCKVFDVSGKGAYIGEPTQLKLYDQVHCLLDQAGNVAVIFVVGRFVDGQMYWNVERMWDSNTQTTTRKPDGNGYYSILLAVNGEQVTLRTKDIEIVNSIDARAAKCCVLQTEEDIITSFHVPGSLYAGITFASWSHVTDISEDGVVTAKKAETGVVDTARMAPDCKVYNVSDYAGVIGEETELREGDQIHGLKGLDGYIYTIYVVSRPVESPIYWNLDRSYNSTTKTTNRKPAEDGYYYFRMAVDTKVVTVRTASKSMANKIDSWVACGLKLSGNTVANAYKFNVVDGCTGGSFASWCNVTAFTGSRLSAKRVLSGSDQGKTYTGYLASGCKIYNVSDAAVNPGEKTTVKLGDLIQCFKDNNDRISMIFVVERGVESEIYWNVSRQYDSANKVTKRTPDAEGYYNIPLAVNGEQKLFKTKDQTIASEVDAIATRVMGLALDGDEIRKVYSAKSVEGYTGGSKAGWCDILSIDGETVTVKKLIAADEDYGTEYTLTIPDGCPVYNGSTNVESFVGEATNLKVGDRIHSLVNGDGEIVLVYIVERPVDVPMYWNVEKFSVVDGVSTRKPADDGYYYLVMATGGEQVTVRTDDIKIVTTIDNRAARCIGLALDGDVITATYMPGNTRQTLGGTFASWYTITDISDDGKITASRTYADGEKVESAYMAENCAVYNTTGIGGFVGCVTAPRVGDTVHGIKDINGNITVLYIVSRPVRSEIYWNVERKYDSVNKVTKRTPDADGYYYITLAVCGEQHTYKTKDQTLITAIDAPATRCVGLELNGDEITWVYYPTWNVEGYTGGSVAGWCDIMSIDGTTYDLRKNISTDDDYGQEYTLTIEADCPVYNGSTNVASHVGEKTMLKVGDRLYCLKNEENKVVYVIVVSRPEAVVGGYCEACGKDMLWKPWDGASDFESGAHYYLADNTEQTITGKVEANTTVCLDLRGKALTGTSNTFRIFNIYGTMNLFDSVGTGTVVANNPSPSMAPVFYVQTGGTFNMYGGTLSSNYAAKRAGVGLVQSTMYMYGGTLTGGEITGTTAGSSGGNLEILPGSTFVMYGGSILDGYSKGYGGNLSLNGSGNIALLGGVISGGNAEIAGGGVYMNGNVTVGGNMKISGNVTSDLYLGSGKKIVLSADRPLTQGAEVWLTMAQPGVFTGVVSQTDVTFFHSNTNDVVMTDTEGKLTLSHVHCTCMGLNDTHTCVDFQAWTAWPTDGKWTSGGHYYLTSNVQDLGTVTVAAGESLSICLNGFDMNGKTSTYRLFVIHGELNICDHKHDNGFGGTITAKYTATGKMAPVFRVQSGGVFNVYGGNFTATNQMLEAGLGVVDSGTMSIYDGKFYGGNVTTTGNNQGGGNISMFNSATLVMYGGEISGGTSAKNGANVFMNNAKCTFKQYGGIITGGTAQYGGGVYGQGTIILGADASVSGNAGGNLFLTDSAMIAIESPLTGQLPIGITLKNGTGVFANTQTDYASAFESDAGFVVAFEDGKLLIKEN